jgi:lipopolysaccharide transport system ATP-binding protein
MAFAIHAENLGKEYRIGSKRRSYRMMREVMADAVTSPFRYARRMIRRQKAGARYEKFWALRNVSFEVTPGEVVGVIGRNGAGKSTLLKILSRITEPTEGRARIYGRVGSLLEVGTGFHPELTGRENIFLNGAILGMSRLDIQRKFDEIVDFAEVEKFIETPVKQYSSGMYLRLAFAVAAHLEPDILLVDEVLAVGDAAFQKKCLGKMSDVANQGRTVLFVSHNMPAIQTLCQRVILLASGSIQCDGLPEDVIQQYLPLSNDQGVAEFGAETVRVGSGKARFRRIRLLNEEQEVVSAVPMGKGCSLELEFETTVPLKTPYVSVRLQSPLRGSLVDWNTNVTHGAIPPMRHGGTMRLNIDRLDLLPGTYYLTLLLHDGAERLDAIENALEVEIAPRAVYPTGNLPMSKFGVIFTPCSWSFDYT